MQIPEKKMHGRLCSCTILPPDKPRVFENAHRLFGVSNIVKILKQLKPNEKNDAMYSIKFQALMREKFPVHGCYGYICQLRFQIEQIQHELNAINQQIVIYRHQHQQNHLLSSSSSPHQSPSAQLQLGMATSPTSSNSIPFYHHSYDQNFNAGISLDPTHGNNVSNNPNAYLDSKENVVNPLWIQNQNPYASNFGVNSAAPNQSTFLSFPFQQELTEVPRDYNGIPAFFDTMDDRQSSYIDSKEAYESSSSEDSLKDTLKDTTQRMSTLMN